MLVWLGDFNYRIELDYDTVVHLVRNFRKGDRSALANLLQEVRTGCAVPVRTCAVYTAPYCSTVTALGLGGSYLADVEVLVAVFSVDQTSIMLDSSCAAPQCIPLDCQATTFKPEKDLIYACRSADQNLHVPHTHVCQQAAQRVLSCRTNCGIRSPAARCSSGCTSSPSPSSRRTSSTSTTRTRWGTTAARSAACPRGPTASSSAARSSPAALRIWAPRRCAACLDERCGRGLCL